MDGRKRKAVDDSRAPQKDQTQSRKRRKTDEPPVEEESENEELEAQIPSAARKIIPIEVEDEIAYAPEEDFKTLRLKPDHAKRPIWICPDKHIFLETFSPIYRQAYDFLIAIAEPVSRPEFIHEYRLTPYSLYAAVSVGLATENIITVLNRLSKTNVPKEIEEFIRSCTGSYGKVKLVLHKNRYFVESPYPEILETLLRDPVIREARVKLAESANPDQLSTSAPPKAVAIPGSSGGGGESSAGLDGPDELAAKLASEDEEGLEEVEAEQQLHSFEIAVDHIKHVKKRCVELDYPLLEEYDFRNDTVNPNLAIDLKQTTSIRAYQEKSLSKMFGNGRARSGVIVLPCGAGKTLVGITATCTIKKSTLVLCTSSVSVEQWRNQYKLWANIDDGALARFTSTSKEWFTDKAGVLITTYTMLSYRGQRSRESELIMQQIRSREWGLLIMDEVHVVPADVFQRVIYELTAAHCKLGLTATLVREDDKIADLNFLIGPKLYEANWLDLQRAGHLANVQCAEVWCEMTPEFYREYLRASPKKRKLLYVMNPNKIHACQFLVNYHEQRGDKIIVFSDNVWALQLYAREMQKPFICGPTSDAERMYILSKFRNSAELKTIFLSKVGDTSIDIPEATVVIQISSHYGSRRQEAQRLGRILRPKGRPTGATEFNAFFYSLVSRDTQEMYYSTKRQQFLVDQGYAFKVIASLPIADSGLELLFKTRKEQLGLLRAVLEASDDAGESETPVDQDDLTARVSRRAMPAARTTGGSLAALSGAAGRVYVEYSKPKEKSVSNRTQLEKILKKMSRAGAAARAQFM